MTELAISNRAWNYDLQGAYKLSGSYVGSSSRKNMKKVGKEYRKTPALYRVTNSEAETVEINKKRKPNSSMKERRRNY